MPFVVVIKDPKKGHAEVVLAPGYDLSYEKRHRYTFELSGHDCHKGVHSARLVSTCSVTLVSNHSVTFK